MVARGFCGKIEAADNSPSVVNVRSIGPTITASLADRTRVRWDWAIYAVGAGALALDAVVAAT